MTDNNTDNLATKPLVGGANAERWTVEYVRGLSTQEEATTYIDSAAKSFTGDMAEVEKRTGAATIKAALATWRAGESGIFDDGRGGSVVLTKGAYAEKFGRTGSLVSRWIALGHALVTCGVRPDGEYTMLNAQGEATPFPLWKVLSSKGGADKKGLSEKMKAGMTPAEIVEFLSAFYGPDGKPVKAPAAPVARLTAKSSEEDGTAVVTDEAGEVKETLDVSKNAVRLALELADVWKRFHTPADGVEGISSADASVIRRAILDAGIMIEDPVKATA